MWIGGFCICGVVVYVVIFMVCDYDLVINYNNVFDCVFCYCDVIILYLNWVCIFFGFYSFGFYIYNDIMSVFGCLQDMFLDIVIQFQLIFV